MMDSNLFRLVYCSRNSVDFGGEDPAAAVTAILSTSRSNNARDGVTGALMFSEGCFAQVLEGELDAVQRTFERIQRDDRHQDVIILEAKPASTRLFGMWDMAMAETKGSAQATAILGKALVDRGGEAGERVVSLLDDLVRRQGDWVHAA